MYGVRRCISRLRRHLRALDHLHEARLPWVGHGVDDVNARAVRPRHDEKSPLHVWVWRVRAEM